MLLQWNFWPAV